MGKYAFEDNVRLTDGRLDKFELNKMEVGQSCLIPLKERVIDGVPKMVPADGINIKLANAAYAPMKFRKKRTEAGVRVFRTE